MQFLSKPFYHVATSFSDISIPQKSVKNIQTHWGRIDILHLYNMESGCVIEVRTFTHFVGYQIQTLFLW